MGCRASKVDDLPLVIRCRDRKRLIKSAADYRYDLSSSHLAYFHAMKDFGYVLSRFVDEQLVIPSPSPSSPVLTLPPDVNNTGSGSSDIHSINGGNQDSESELSVPLDNHIHIHDDDNNNSGFQNNNQPHGYNSNEPYEINRGQPPYQPPWGDPYMINPSAFPYQPPWGPNGDPYAMNPSASQYPPWGWGPYQSNFDPYNGYDGNSNSNSNSNRYAFYMKKSAPASHTVIQPEEARGFQETETGPPYYDPYASGYGYGFSYGGSSYPPQEPEKPKSPPPPPPPMESDYFNFFNTYDNEYPGYGYGYGYETTGSSPDTVEVREREGIPDLEEETETESRYEDAIKMKTFSKKRNLDKGKAHIEGSLKKETSSSTEGSYGKLPTGSSLDTVEVREREGIPDLEEETETESHYEEAIKISKKRNLDKGKEHIGESSKKATSTEGSSGKVPSGKNEGTAHIESTSNSGNSVNTEVDKHSSETIISEGHEGDEGSIQELESSVMSSLTTLSPHGSRDLHEVVNEIKDEFESAFSHGKEVALMLEAGKLPYQSKFAVLKVILSKIIYPLAPSDHSQVTKLAGSYNKDANLDVRPVNLSSTLEKLCAWEKRLYKEVKGEERLRILYEKMVKKLNEMDAKGAESSKIDDAEASRRRLETKLNVSIKIIDVISCEIQKVRDNELQPQLRELIHGLIRMWRSMEKCHRKQLEAIMESRRRTLRASTSLERDSSLRATLELETGLLTWARHFKNWINAQKLYVSSLNGWLQQCIDHEQEVTIDGEVPYSPGRLGAPPIFIICNDWHREIKGVSQEKVLKSMHSFGLNLRQLVERQDEMQRLMVKKEDFVRKSQSRRLDETHGSMVRSEDRVGPDYNEAMKLVQNGGSSSLQGGVTPIFKALEVFTRDALKAHERVRLRQVG